ncbi:hypothetical protein COV11_01075 [Candidatus Woesearchaeota archaeon CG10_big_fil_rev_8_21_14_0_10_30_7]|nr:MAG: hypothetical protein COV11_01075 [Candidatus Woesearchaeota archaeon CG10_big_fil_rev_8_21_14_0_10_30_7]
MNGGEIIIPKGNVYGVKVKNPPSEKEVEVLLAQIKENGWHFNYEDQLRLSKGKKFLMPIIDDFPKIPSAREVQFRLYDETEFGLIEDNFLLPGFLLSPDTDSLDLESELDRTCDYLMYKHLLPYDDPTKKINVGQHHYKITKVSIIGVNPDKTVELSVECKRTTNPPKYRCGFVDYFLNEIIPVLKGGYTEPRLKALLEFDRVILQENPDIFRNLKRNELSDNWDRAYKILHTLENKLLSTCEPKTFKKYNVTDESGTFVFDSATSTFDGVVQLYDLDRELFNTPTRLNVKRVYELGFTGKCKETREFKRDRLLAKMNAKDRAFYEGTIHGLNNDCFIGKPLKLRISSEVKSC